MEYVIVALQIVSLLVLGWLVGGYLPKYFSKKGENLATKEDIEEITKKIENVKLDYSEKLETIKALFSSKLYIYQVRYEKEFEILFKLSERLVDLRDAALLLRPVMEYASDDETEEEAKKRKLKRYFEALQKYYRDTEIYRPFYPEELYKLVSELDKSIWSEVVEYKGRSPYDERDKDYDYWGKAEENSKKISESADKLIDAIRQRVKLWENIELQK